MSDEQYEVVDDNEYEAALKPETEFSDILSDEQLEDLRTYIQKEIQDTRAEGGREARIARNKEIDRQRQIRPEFDEKNFPWDGAANTVPPLMWTKLSSVVSKFTQALLNKDPLFVYESADQEHADHAKAITNHVESIINDPNQANFRKKIWPLEFDKASFGTVFVKVPFENEVRYFKRPDPETGEMIKVEQKIRSCPIPYIIPFEDFFTRYQWDNIQTAPWIAVRTRKYWHQLKAYQTDGFYSNVDLILDNNTYLDDNKIEKLENAGVTEQDYSIDYNKIYEIFEINVFYDADEDGHLQDLIVHYEPESDTILRLEYNDLGRRDIVRIPYVEFTQILYGMGIGDMTSNLQSMIESVFNNSFNSDELSYMGLIVTPQGSGLEYGKDVRPGAVLPVPNPDKDIKVIQMPSVTTQAMLLEQKIQNYADQATGASSAMIGQESKGEGNRIGATGTQFLAAKGDAYLQAFLELAVNGYQEIGELILLQLVRNSSDIDLSNRPESEQVLLREVYNTPVEDIPSKFKFKVSMADIQQEMQQRQQALVQLFQLYSAFMDKITQLSASMSNPQMNQPGFERLQEVLLTSFVGYNKMFERILDNFNEKEISDYLPEYKDIEFMLEKMDKQKEELLERAKTESNTETAGAFGFETTDGEGLGDPEGLRTGVPANSEGYIESPSTPGVE